MVPVGAAQPDSPYRDYYVWRDEPPPDTGDEVVFPDEETASGSWTSKAGEYYLHRFYRHQPDLNVDQPGGARRDRQDRRLLAGSWAVDGFRVDAVPFLIETHGRSAAARDGPPRPAPATQDLRAFLSRRNGEAMLLGEVNLPYKDQVKFFGGDGRRRADDAVRLHRHAADLPLAGPAGRRPLARALRRPARPRDASGPSFLRNHDELTLDKLTDAERQEVFDAFGPEPEMQLYGRGLLRRLPPMLDGDPRRLRMAYSLMFSLPGHPGAVLRRGDRDGREPRRRGPAGGAHADAVVGRAAQRRLLRRRAVAAAQPGARRARTGRRRQRRDQRRDRDSLLSFMRELIRRYRECPELGWGESSCSTTTARGARATAAAGRTQPWWRCTTSPARTGQVDLTLAGEAAGVRLTDLFTVASELTVGAGGAVSVPLAPYGTHWFRVLRDGERWLT